MFSLPPQHDEHVVDRKYQGAAAYGLNAAEETFRLFEERFAPARANIAAMRRIAPEAFRPRKPHLVIVKK